MSAATVELLYFAGCPNVEATQALIERVAAEEGVRLDVRLVEVAPDGAERFRFLGSPSVRVNGHDVEPGADQRTTFMFACRVYSAPHGLAVRPASEWVRAALKA